MIGNLENVQFCRSEGDYGMRCMTKPKRNGETHSASKRGKLDHGTEMVLVHNNLRAPPFVMQVILKGSSLHLPIALIPK